MASAVPTKVRTDATGAALQEPSVIVRTAAEELRDSERRFREMIDALPAAVYTTDAEGRLTHFNPAAVELSGRVPQLGTDHWCVSWKLYHADGTPMPHDECPMAITLKTGRIVRGTEAIAERPDGTRIWFEPYPTPLRGADGRIVGGINMLVDITDRKRAEAASGRLAAIVESSDDAIISKTLDGIITSWNRSAENVFGYSSAEALGQPIHIIIPAERRSEEDNVLARLRRGEKVDHFETERQTKDGRRVSLSLTISPIRDAAGRIIGASKVARDITERKRAEAAVRESQERLRRNAETFSKLVERSPFGIYTVDSEFRIAQVSAGAQPAFRNVRPLIGHDFAEAMRILWPEPLADEIIEIFRHTLKTGEPYVAPSLTAQRCDVEAVESYEWRIHRDTLPDGQYGVVCYFFDATQLRQAEHALRESEERFRSLVSVITDVPWVTDANGAFVARQAAWEAYTGQTWEEHRGFGWADALHPEDRAEVLALWERARKERTAYESHGRIWHEPTGQYRHFRAQAAPVLNADGGVREWVGTCTDIDDQRRMLDEREEILASERAARSEAERASHLKEEFLATLSHELRTPLNAILGWAQLIKRSRMPADDIAQGIEVIEQNARVQAQLIEDLLDISRITSGKLRLDVQTLDLAPVVEAALAAVRPTAEAKQIRLERTLDPAAGPVKGDPARLQQVIWNLLTNAIKFTPKGGQVCVAASRVDSQVEITVSDTGHGIKAEFLPFVFERFRQGDATTTRQFGGLGLGLSIVKHLVELHAGEVRVSSAGEGKGASFTVTLPVLTLSESQPPATPPRSAEDAGGTLRLPGVAALIVDDEKDARELIRRVLTDAEVHVTLADSVTEALRLFAQRPPHILISDIGMSGEDGYDLIRRIRALPAEDGGTVPAIALTAYARSQDRTRAILAGYNTHISKPVQAAELVAVAAGLLGRTSGRQA